MPLSNRNTITPRKKLLRRWGFTTREGGTIVRFEYPDSDSAYKRMHQHLADRENWGRYEGPHPEGGARSYTSVRLIPGYDVVRVHSMFFPDGRVWDSTFRNFRKIRDYEIKS